MITAADDYFGLCPHCHKTNGYINIGSSHWFFCEEHKTKWHLGANLFSSWKHQTEEQMQAQYDLMGFGNYTEVEPYYYPKPERKAEVRKQAHDLVQEIICGLGPLAVSGVFDDETRVMLGKYLHALHDIIDGDAIGTYQMRKQEMFDAVNADPEARAFLSEVLDAATDKGE